MSAGSPEWTLELVEERLRGLEVRRRPVAAALAPVHAAYRDAAAVLAWFDPVAIGPAGGIAPLSAPLPAFLADCAQIHAASGEGRWTLKPEIRRATLAGLIERSAVDEALAANASRPDDPLQRMLEAHLHRKAPPIERQSLPELTRATREKAPTTASRWRPSPTISARRTSRRCLVGERERGGA